MRVGQTLLLTASVAAALVGCKVRNTSATQSVTSPRASNGGKKYVYEYQFSSTAMRPWDSAMDTTQPNNAACLYVANIAPDSNLVGNRNGIFNEARSITAHAIDLGHVQAFTKGNELEPTRKTLQQDNDNNVQDTVRIPATEESLDKVVEIYRRGEVADAEECPNFHPRAPGGTGEQPQFDKVAMLGLWRDNRSLEKKVTADSPLGQEWTGPGGFEYWLFSSAGGTGYVGHGGDGATYSPFPPREGPRPRCGGTGAEAANETYCATQVSALAKRCMRQAGETLKEIMDMNLPEYQDWLTRNRAPSYYGWIDDAAAIGYAGDKAKTGPFKWNGYMKWAGNVRTDGTCTTGSLGQFLKFLETYDGHETFKKN